MMDGKGHAHEPAGTPKGGRFARKTMFDADGDLDCAPIPAADRAARLQERYGRRWERLDPDCRYDDTRLVVSYMDGGTGVVMLGDCRDANTLDVLESGRPCGDIASIAVKPGFHYSDKARAAAALVDEVVRADRDKRPMDYAGLREHGIDPEGVDRAISEGLLRYADSDERTFLPTSFLEQRRYHLTGTHDFIPDRLDFDAVDGFDVCRIEDLERSRKERNQIL